MDIIGVYFTGLVAIIAAMTLVWLLSLWLGNSSIVDIFWGLMFIFATVFYALMTEGYDQRRMVLLALVTLWGLRLAAHIGFRNWGEPEDYRYNAWRKQYGESYWWVSYFKVFLLQGVILWLVSLPLLLILAADEPANLTLYDYLGIIMWAVGFFFEAVGDWQLLRFKADPQNKGKVLDSGLWRYTRHPNYFGECVIWWGVFLIALSVDGGWLSIFSPIIMTYLLLKVSGVAMLEPGLKKTKPAYADYIRRTSAFIPRPPKR